MLWMVFFLTQTSLSKQQLHVLGAPAQSHISHQGFDMLFLVTIIIASDVCTGKAAWFEKINLSKFCPQQKKVFY